MKIENKLLEIQQKLNAPKGNYNSFGKYSYRSCEDILEAVKPLLKEQKAVLTITDKMIVLGDRYYIEATATLKDCESEESISNTALAREEETKKGMDASQITGSASSYARKYALNGLFCIDDVKDADTRDNRTEEAKKQAEDEKRIQELANQKIDAIKANALIKRCENDGVSPTKLAALYKVKNVFDLTEKQHSNANLHWDEIKERCAK